MENSCRETRENGAAKKLNINGRGKEKSLERKQSLSLPNAI